MVDNSSGILKGYIPTTHRTISSKFHDYFGRRRPSLQIRAPHLPSFLNGDLYEESPLSISSNPSTQTRSSPSPTQTSFPRHL